MNYSKEEEQRLREWLNKIWAISLDRDGCKSAEDLGKLVDELHEMSAAALKGEESGFEE